MKRNLQYLSLIMSTLSLVGGSIASSLTISWNDENIANQCLENKGVSSNLLKINDDVRKNFESNINNTYIEKENIIGKVSVNLDSYQQSNKLSHSNPELKYSYKFQTSLNISNPIKFNNIKNVDDFKKTLNSNPDNIWSYNVSSWWAKAGKRFMGVNIVMPHWAPEVFQNHSEKKFDYWESSQVEKACKFTLNELIKFVESCNFNLKMEDKYKKIIKTNLSDLSFKTKLKPVIKSIKIDEIKEIDFGNVRTKIIDNYELEIFSNHLLPIIDYNTKWECSGPKCSHNIRNLVDVVMTALTDLIKYVFGDSDSFVSDIVQVCIRGFIIKSLYNLLKEEKLNKNLYDFLIKMTEYAFNTNLYNKAFQYVNENLSDILFTFTGRVLKHGIQLGKCGHLVSGIKIDRWENISKLKSIKPLILFNVKPLYIFKNNSNFDLNSLECIIELSNYKKLYNYLDSKEIDNNVKNILYWNIKNQTSSSKDIYNGYLKYLEKNIIPNKYNVKLDTFNKFINDGWKIPVDIETWDLLYKYIIPSYLSEKHMEIRNKESVIFYDNYSFTLNDNLKINSNVHTKKEEYNITNYLG